MLGLGYWFVVEEVGAGGVGVGEFGFCGGVVEVVVEAVPEAVDAVLDVDCCWELLVGGG